MNRYKNYKSAVQFYNSNAQAVTATTTVTNPLLIALGGKVTETGSALDLDSSSIDIEASGLYRISADINFTGTVGGDVTFALTLNGQVMPETIRTVTTATGISTAVLTETVRVLNTCCNISDYVIGVIAFSDGTATGTVSRISGNVIKL